MSEPFVSHVSKEPGNCSRNGKTTWLACIDLSTWQRMKLLDVVIGMTTKHLMYTDNETGESFCHTAHALEVNESDMHAVNAVLVAENCNVLRKQV